MKPKKLITWAIVAFLGYQLFGYVKEHTSPQVIAYKRFANAVMNGNLAIAEDRAVEGYARQVMASQAAREELFDGYDVVFTYYEVKSISVDPSGTSATVHAEQVTRVNPEHESVLWGKEAIRIRHSVRLVKDKDVWLVTNFTDPGSDR
ncbi:MAG: hypothetical protein AAGC73_00390 [Verrucomicrobiota bacterium]